MFNILIILIAVINLTNSQESLETDSVAILSGLSTASLDCSLNFNSKFIAENEAIATAIEEFLSQRDDDVAREERKGRDGDSTRKPCDDDETDLTEEAATEAPSDLELRRNLRKGKQRGRRDDDSTREPKDSTSERRERKSRDDSTREPKDVTREPCVGDDCQRRHKGRKGDRKSRKGEDETTEAPEDDLELRRNLRKGNRGGDNDSTREPKDVTRGPKPTREPKDVTREPCVGDDCQRRHKGRKGDRKSRKGRGDSEDSDDLATTAIPRRRLLRREETERNDDSTKEPCEKTREPCDGDDCQRGRKGRKGGRKSRKGDDSTTEAPEDVPALRRALERDGKHKRGKGIDATISNGLVDIAGVTGEVVFGTVDEALESIPLSLTIGETTFTCNVEVRRGNKVSCIAVSDDFRVRVGCELEL